MKWIIIDGKGRRRLAKPNELPKPLIDNSEISLEDGDLVLPKSDVNRYENKNERKSNRKKNTKV
jgi:hypothetical protein